MAKTVKKLTLDEDERVLMGAAVACDWLLLSDCVILCVVAVVVCESVTGNDSGTVCNVVLIVVDIFLKIFFSHFSLNLMIFQ